MFWAQSASGRPTLLISTCRPAVTLPLRACLSVVRGRAPALAPSDVLDPPRQRPKPHTSAMRAPTCARFPRACAPVSSPLSLTRGMPLSDLSPTLDPHVCSKKPGLDLAIDTALVVLHGLWPKGIKEAMAGSFWSYANAMTASGRFQELWFPPWCRSWWQRRTPNTAVDDAPLVRPSSGSVTGPW